MELECMSIFTSTSPVREMPLAAHSTAHGACGSATAGPAAAWWAQPLGCGGSTTVLETTAGPSLYWYKTARNKQYQNWRSFSVHLLIGPVLRKHGCQSSSDLARGQCPRSPSRRRTGQAGSNIAFPWALPPEGLTWAGQQHWDCFNTYS